MFLFKFDLLIYVNVSWKETAAVQVNDKQYLLQ